MNAPTFSISRAYTEQSIFDPQAGKITELIPVTVVSVQTDMSTAPVVEINPDPSRACDYIGEIMVSAPNRPPLTIKFRIMASNLHEATQNFHDCAQKALEEFESQQTRSLLLTPGSKR